MNVLFVAPFVPVQPMDGDRLRALWTLRTLASKHRVFGFFLDPDGRRALPAGVRALCADTVLAPLPAWRRAAGILRAVFSDRPIGAEAFFDGAAMGVLSRALMGWPADVVHAHRLRMMPYALRLALPCVLDATDCLTEYFRRAGPGMSGGRRVYSWMELGRLKRYEKLWCNRARAVVAITPAEGQRLKAIGVRTPIFIAPNGIDLKYWRLRGMAPGREKRLVFMGNLGYPPNESGLAWFFRKIVPLIGPAGGDAVICVLGRGAGRRLESAAGSSRIRVVFKGYVGDPRAELARASAMICPLQIASGLQNKALQAMACGLPVISTSAVARGLGAKPGKEIFTADREADFAGLCRRALEGGRDFTVVAQNARKLVERRYDAEHAGRGIRAACEAAARGRGRKV